MKKLTLLAVAFVAVSFASCKKDYTCTCTTTPGTATASVTKIIGVSKKAAQANCVSGTTTETDASGSEVYTRNCTLSK
jgi:hypothetical protein